MKGGIKSQGSTAGRDRLFWTWGRGVLAVCLLSITASAQPFALDWHTIDGGGGTSSNGQYAVSGTIGQPDAGAMAGGNYAIQGGFWSAYMAVQVPGAPTLSIQRVGANVEVSWLVEGSAGFALGEAESLTGKVSWVSTGATPAVINGRNVVTLPIQAGQHFFRLSSPSN